MVRGVLKQHRCPLIAPSVPRDCCQLFSVADYTLQGGQACRSADFQNAQVYNGDSVIVWVSVHSPALCGSAAA